jgi:hypothetical protein
VQRTAPLLVEAVSLSVIVAPSSGAGRRNSFLLLKPRLLLSLGFLNLGGAKVAVGEGEGVNVGVGGIGVGVNVAVLVKVGVMVAVGVIRDLV